MPRTVDFRTVAFDAARVDASGKDVGRRVYWKLYAIENILRIIINSVLIAQIGPGWWNLAVDPRIRQRVQDRKTSYAQQPWHTLPGVHDIYYTFLTELNEIIRANRNLFVVIIRDIDQWIARIEQIRLPRNIVGHMNWLGSPDRSRVDIFYSDIQALVSYLAASKLILEAP